VFAEQIDAPAIHSQHIHRPVPGCLNDLHVAERDALKKKLTSAERRASIYKALLHKEKALRTADASSSAITPGYATARRLSR
jgi:hypothetical protein